jgi:hypothetical protein
MMEHPAHRIAGMAADVAGELRGYLAPAVDLPWELTEDDHRDLVPRLRDAVARLADCIGSGPCGSWEQPASKNQLLTTSRCPNTDRAACPGRAQLVRAMAR